jgi:hypothetical protein
MPMQSSSPSLIDAQGFAQQRKTGSEGCEVSRKKVRNFPHRTREILKAISLVSAGGYNDAETELLARIVSHAD